MHYLSCMQEIGFGLHKKVVHLFVHFNYLFLSRIVSLLRSWSWIHLSCSFYVCIVCRSRCAFLCFCFWLGRHTSSSRDVSRKLDGNVNNQTYTQGQHSDAFSFGQVSFYFTLKFYSNLIHTFRFVGFDWIYNSDVCLYECHVKETVSWFRWII